jgi:hypothetical protein
MVRRTPPITYKDFRPLGIGRLTCCAEGTAARPGILVGSHKGLFHLANPDARIRRVRKHSVDFIVSGETGVVCHEETRTEGRLAILDSRLEELRTDVDLARTINPVAFWNNGIVVFHQDNFDWIDPVSMSRRRIAEFQQVHAMTPLVPVKDGCEFLAAYRKPDWPTYLHKLLLPMSEELDGRVEELARCEDPVMTRHFVRLTPSRYLVVPQGKPIFLILKVFGGTESSLRSWELVPIAGGAHPVGLVRKGNALFAAVGESLLQFDLSGEFAQGGGLDHAVI